MTKSIFVLIMSTFVALTSLTGASANAGPKNSRRISNLDPNKVSAFESLVRQTRFAYSEPSKGNSANEPIITAENQATALTKFHESLADLIRSGDQKTPVSHRINLTFQVINSLSESRDGDDIMKTIGSARRPKLIVASSNELGRFYAQAAFFLLPEVYETGFLDMNANSLPLLNKIITACANHSDFATVEKIMSAATQSAAKLTSSDSDKNAAKSNAAFARKIYYLIKLAPVASLLGRRADPNLLDLMTSLLNFMMVARVTNKDLLKEARNLSSLMTGIDFDGHVAMARGRLAKPTPELSTKVLEFKKYLDEVHVDRMDSTLLGIFCERLLGSAAVPSTQ